MENEKRLLDAKKALYLAEQSGLYDFDLSGLETLLFDEPCITVDAVEVVRCKDCEFWGGVTFGNVCRRWSAPLAGMKNCTTPDDFCSYGERRPDGNTPL